jgi:3-dehydroquinate synthetase
MEGEKCAYHEQLATDIALIKQGMDFIRETISQDRTKTQAHIHEGEREGGVRDRLTTVETQLKTLKRDKWWVAIVGGVIGGLIGAQAPGLIRDIVGVLTGR